MKFKKVFFEIIYWTWCLPQTLIGLIVYSVVKLFDRDVDEHIIQKTLTHVIESEKFGGGVSLGRYILIYDYDDKYGEKTEWTECLEKEMEKHEWGHTLQNFLLGPLYLFIIGIPSIVWAAFFRKYRRENGISYYSFYTERWADRWGGVER